MGASGNMVMAALYELLPDKTIFHEAMQRLGLPGVVLNYSASTKCGITGTHISVKIDGDEEKSDDVYNDDHEHHQHGHANHHHDNHHDHGNHHNHDNHHEHTNHSHDHHHSHSHKDTGNKGRRYNYKEILTLIKELDLPAKVKENAAGVYEILGKAEAKVHGTPLDEIHFHEVGSIDAVVDVVGCSLLVDMLEITEITASPVHVGFGMVRCEHGILPVPAPATAEILNGIPMYSGRIEGELCTPTGAAILKRFVSNFGPMPVMTAKNIGYGMGTKDFEAANCLRAFLFDPAVENDQDTVIEISCNLDDMTPEAIGSAFDILLENGALDVYITPIMMKKNRPAVMLSCLCKEGDNEALADIMINHTTTLGVRSKKYSRTVMERSTSTVHTEYGDIRIKHAKGFNTEKHKPEYEDVIKAAKAHNVPFQQVYDTALNQRKPTKSIDE